MTNVMINRRVLSSGEKSMRGEREQWKMMDDNDDYNLSLRVSP